MARKKIEHISGLGNEDKLTVQKSLPLFSLWRSELSLAEFKILDTYLARIDSHKPEKRAVVFEKGELEEKLGVQRIRTEELDERLKHLGSSIRIDDPNSKNKKFTRITLFEKAVAEQDETGLWTVELTASQSAMKYFFNIENLGYLRYKLRCVTSLSSRYTYIMFCYLENNRTMHLSWTVELEKLKTILHCENEETYKEFKFFNRDILKKIQKEIHEKTECRYEYEPVKKGRSVVAVHFTLESLTTQISLEDYDSNQMTLEQWQEENREGALWEEAVEEFGFTSEQITALQEVLVCIPEHRMPQSIACYDAIDLRRYHYMRIKVAEMKNRPNIKNHYSYLLKMLKQDADI